MADKRWKFVKVVNSLAIIEFDNEQYIEVKNNKHSDYCHRCDLYGTYDDSGCYVFMANKSKCPAQSREDLQHSYFIKGGL